MEEIQIGCRVDALQRRAAAILGGVNFVKPAEFDPRENMVGALLFLEARHQLAVD